jgi:hypothetical protein
VPDVLVVDEDLAHEAADHSGSRSERRRQQVAVLFGASWNGPVLANCFKLPPNDASCSAAFHKSLWSPTHPALRARPTARPASIRASLMACAAWYAPETFLAFENHRSVGGPEGCVKQLGPRGRALVARLGHRRLPAVPPA